MLAELRHRLLSSSRYVDALLVVEHPDGRELFRAGGLWDTVDRRYCLRRPATPHRFRLKRSQVEPDPASGMSIADGFSRWLDLMRRGIDDGRILGLIGAGNRGSGKTLFLGSLVAVIVALEWPKGSQFSVNLSGKQKRECIEGMARIIPPPARPGGPTWVANDVQDPRDPYREFLTGHKLFWRTGKAPAALREGGITFHYGFVNEGQDQTPEVAMNAIGAVRNIGSLVGIATNPDPDGGWVGDVVEQIESGQLAGERYLLEARYNDAINQAAQPKIAGFLYAIDKEQADADAKGSFRRRGAAYEYLLPGDPEPRVFNAAPRLMDAAGAWLSGHVGRPPPVPEIGPPRWTDITREETARLCGGGSGFDWIGGSDFQRSPGCCIAIGKIYRDETGSIVLYIRQFIGVPGDEHDLTQAIVNAGYYPGAEDMEGRAAPNRSMLIVGDGTGNIQDSTHRRGNPYSFTALIADGWKVVPPMRHYKTRKPCNPLVLDSRKQMFTAHSSGWLMYDPACGDPAADFPSLLDGMKKSTVNSAGKFVKKGHYTHGPDGVRYLAWAVLPRNRPAPVDTTPDLSIFAAIRAKAGTKTG